MTILKNGTRAWGDVGSYQYLLSSLEDNVRGGASDIKPLIDGLRDKGLSIGLDENRIESDVKSIIQKLQLEESLSRNCRSIPSISEEAHELSEEDLNDASDFLTNLTKETI